MAGPRGYTKKQSQLARQRLDTTAILQTAPMTAATVEIMELGMVAQKLTYSSTGGMSATIEFTMDGVNWFGSATASATPANYSTNLVKAVRVTWISGSGTVVVAAV